LAFGRVGADLLPIVDRIFRALDLGNRVIRQLLQRNRDALFFANVMNGANVGKVQCRSSTRLAVKAF
jgi:hypothetical protein